MSGFDGPLRYPDTREIQACQTRPGVDAGGMAPAIKTTFRWIKNLALLTLGLTFSSVVVSVGFLVLVGTLALLLWLNEITSNAVLGFVVLAVIVLACNAHANSRSKR